MPPGPCCEAPQSRASCQKRAAASLSAAPSTSPQAAFSLFLPLFSVLATCVCVCVYACARFRGEGQQSSEEMLFFCFLSVPLILFCFFHTKGNLENSLHAEYSSNNHPSPFGGAGSVLLATQTACLGNHTRRRASMHSQLLLLTQGTTMGSTVTQKPALQQAAIWPRAAITLNSLAGSVVVRAGRGQVAMET